MCGKRLANLRRSNDPGELQRACYCHRLLHTSESGERQLHNQNFQSAASGTSRNYSTNRRDQLAIWLYVHDKRISSFSAGGESAHLERNWRSSSRTDFVDRWGAFWN